VGVVMAWSTWFVVLREAGLVRLLWWVVVVSPLPERGDLSLMTGCGGVSLMSFVATVYGGILLGRIQPHVDPQLRSSRASFGSCRSRHASWGIKEGFGELWLPLAVTFVDLGAFGSISGYVVF